MNVRSNSTSAPVAPATSAGSSAQPLSADGSTTGFADGSGFEAAAPTVPQTPAALQAAFNDARRWKGFSQAQVEKARGRAETQLTQWMQANPAATPEEVNLAAKKAVGQAWANAVADKGFFDRLLFFLQQRTQDFAQELNSDWNSY